MKEVLFRELREGDFEQIKHIPHEEGLEKHPDFLKWEKVLKDNGAAYTCLTPEGEIICCFGVRILWQGVGEVWLTFTDLLNEYQRETVILTGKLLNAMQKELCLVRLQADVLADIEVSNRFIKHYGFELEGRMKKYNPYGFDVNRYARVRG